MVVSSVNICRTPSPSAVSGRSLQNKENSVGPRTDP